MGHKSLVSGLIALLLISGIATNSFAIAENAKHAEKFGQVVVIDGGRYTNHDVIRINNDTDFATLAGSEGWLGNGTQNDPYIISGYDIDAHGAGDAIYIGNTTVYFVVENCYLHNASDGIMLYNITNGKIEENYITNNEYGIYLDGYSSSNTIYKNNVTNNSNNGIEITSFSYNNIIDGNLITDNENNGLELHFSRDSIVRENSIMQNGYNGIWMWGSDANVISENNISGNWYSIYVADSINNRISGNIMINNSLYISGNKSTFTTQNITTNNTVNGKPIYYYKNVNMNNATAPIDAGEVILGNVTWFKIEGLNITNTTLGVEVGYSTHIIVSKNYMTTQGDWSILLESTNNSIIANNSLIGGSSGIGLYSSNANMIMGNNITNGDGITLGSSTTNVIEENSIINDYNGITLLDSSNRNVIYNNYISLNQRYGIWIYSGFSNVIYHNTFYRNGYYDTRQACDEGYNNFWNSSSGIGNYWHDWANNNDTNDQNNDGIVDWPYKIDGSAGSEDYYPLKNSSLSNVLSHPMNLTVKLGNGYVNLTWEPPVYGKDTVTQYNIYRNGVLIKIKTVSGNQLYYNDTTVQNGQTYRYYVTAVNSVGESNPSNKVQTTAGGTVPEFPDMNLLTPFLFILLIGIIVWRKKR